MQSQTQVGDALKRLDLNGKGAISPVALRSLLSRLGLVGEEIALILDTAKLNSSGEVRVDEFVEELFGSLTQQDAKAGYAGSDSRPNLLKNSAFVFVKPHAQTEAVRRLVKERLTANHISILKEGEISAKDIDEKKLIDQHYYAIASKATLLTPDKLPVPADKFKDAFGEDWSAVLAAGKAVNAMQACKDFGIDAGRLEEEWRKCEPAGAVVKFGGGFYCGKMTLDGNTRYVFNAFFMKMRSKFTEPGCSIYYYSVEWTPDNCSWAQFRGSVLGPTDPGSAPVGSIRRTIYDQWNTLGLTSEPNKGDNGVHASASPFEGLAERMNWLEVPVSQDSMGAALMANGMSQDLIKSWALDPQIKLEDGRSGSAFDALEDLDVVPCLDKLNALRAVNSSSS